MLFNSLEFVVFFFCVLALYWRLGRRAQNLLLLAASYVFYGWWDWRFLSLILTSTFVDYVSGRRIAASERPGARRAWLALSVATNLSLLGFFKYFNFFQESLVSLLSTVGWEVGRTELRIILPVGISFYTFQTMGYTIDVFRRKVGPERNFLTFALFVAFFPQLVAGPIETAGRLLPQFRRGRQLTRDRLADGIWCLLWGFFLKIYVADNLGRVVDAVFTGDGNVPGPEVLVATYAFAFQILGDFAGYSSIAIGVAKLLGIDLMTNFLYPYFVTNPRDFWRNWHISLSSWLRDYLYIPLGGNRGSRLATYRNLMLTMLLGGLWHGAAWTFVVWGAYHGLLLAGHRAASEHGWLGSRDGGNALLKKGLAVLLMFHLTCLGWLIFRAESFAQCVHLVGSVATRLLEWSPRAEYFLIATLFFVIPVVLVQWIQRYLSPNLLRAPMGEWRRAALACSLIVVLFAWGEFGGREFVYFQF